MRLNEAETVGVANELRRYADYRESATWVDYDVSAAEIAADLGSDPTYAGAPAEVWQNRYDEEERQTAQLQEKAVSGSDVYRDMADDVERTGDLDLNARDLLVEVIDNAGWSLSDPDARPPEEWRRVVAALDEVRQQQQADQSPTSPPVLDEADRSRVRLPAGGWADQLPAVVKTASAAGPDAVLTAVELATLHSEPVLHLGWQEPTSGVQHDAYAAVDSGRIVLVTTDGAYGQPGVYAERTGPGALAGLVPGDSDGQRMANQLEAALQAELPAANLAGPAHGDQLSADELRELHEASAAAALTFGPAQSERPVDQASTRRQLDGAGRLSERQR